jgi:hypothetical protein
MLNPSLSAITLLAMFAWSWRNSTGEKPASTAASRSARATALA